MERVPYFDHLRRLILTGLVAGLLGHPAVTFSAQRLSLPDSQNRLVDPFDAPGGTRALVFLFISTDCPVSNRYAPEIRRLHDRFSAKGVAFRLVYPNPNDSPAAIRAHVSEYGYPGTTLRDPQHQLVKLVAASITPEVAVFDAARRMVYRGRIDDRYVDLGVQRPAPTRRDLEEALTAVLAGQAVPEPITQAVGCFIADFLQ